MLKPTPASQTPTTAAKARRQDADVRKFEGKEGGVVLSKPVRNQLKRAKDFRRVNEIMEPWLQKMVPQHFLVNCEDINWGPGLGQPDFFATRCYVAVSPKQKRKGSHYGRPALMDSVTALFDGKLDIQISHEDRLHALLSHTSASFGLLYDKKGFRLLIAHGERGTSKQLMEIWSGVWEQGGTLQFLAEKFAEPAHERRLGACLADCGATMLGFLGQGGFGRVFKVKRKNAHYAMKVAT
ncbi:unnamed protein product, partial [Symbiodinium necroappetens]